MRITWLRLEERLEHELRQLAEEGVDASAIEREWLSLEGLEPAERAGTAGRLLDRCRELSESARPPVGDEEPLVSLAARRAGPAVDLDPASYRRRVLAGWTGRMAGCLLGKPVEKVPRAGIREILRSSGRWPLDGYFTAEGVPALVLERFPWNRASHGTSLRENIACMPEDDDINFAMLNLAVLEAAGPDCTTADVAAAWLGLLPALTVFTAERVAYRNLLDYLEPPETARHRNPYREWIGAQIRADVWGWVSPGDPTRAAELAWRDARLSHVENGVFAEMFAAAMVAAAFVLRDPTEVVRAGLGVVPARSRLAEAVRFALSLPDREPDWERAVDRLEARYGHYHWVHAINNSALVTAALVYGQGDFGRSVALAVMGGWDTDCNGATVGSIVATMAGSVPRAWSDPLGNRVRSSLKGFDGISIDELARRTVAQGPTAFRGAA